MRPFMSEETLTFSTMVELLQWRGREQPDQEAYRFLLDGEMTEESMTYAELDRQARMIGGMLQQMGAVGERVLLLYQPGLDYIAAFFGCLYAGSIAVPAYPPSSRRLMPRLHAIAVDSQAKAALTTSRIAADIQEGFTSLPGMDRLVWLVTDQLQTVSDADWKQPELTRDSLAFLQYTSGSTSTPKGVMVSHGNLLHNLSLIKESFTIDSQDRSVIWLPPYHDMGLIGGILQSLYTGFHTTLMSPFDMMQRPLRWLQAITRKQATISGGPNFAYDLCVRKITEEQKRELDLSSWQVAFNGAEPIRHETLERFAEAFASCGFRKEAFYTCYGLAEGTLFVSGGQRNVFPVVRTFDKEALSDNRVLEMSDAAEKGDGQTLIGCGRSASDQLLCIVHPETKVRCAPDEIGEIWVAGPSVAHGYWGNEAQSTETFAARLSDTGEGPFLRTGDLGFLHKDELFVTGRLKDLIIIRGRNYYPQDIELSAYRSHQALRPECAAFSIEVDGEERLAVVAEIDRHYRQVDAEEVIGCIRQAIAQEHGLQVYAVQLVRFGSIPKTSSGKIQRRFCREAFLSDSFHKIGSDVLHLEPSNDEPEQEVIRREMLLAMTPQECQAQLESYLGRLVRRVLQLTPSQFDPEQPLSTLGIDSAQVMELQHAVETDLGVILHPAQLFDIDTTQLADVIRAELSEAASGVGLLERATGRAETALSRGQQALWFLHRMAPESAAYNISKAVRLSGRLDTAALRAAFQALIRRHDILRTTYPAQPGGVPRAHIHEQAELAMTEVDASSWDADLLQQRMEEAAQRPFDLEQGPLMRVYLYKRSAEEHLLLWSFHHIVVDLWSFDLLIGEWNQLYVEFSTGEKQYLPPAAIRYADYVAWQERMLSSEEGEQKWAYWKEQLAGELPILNMPTDHARPPMQSWRGAVKSLRLPQSLADALKRLSREQQTTLYTTLLTGYAVLLHRYSGQEDVIIGSPMAARSRVELAGLVGYLTNTVPIRVDLSGNLAFDRLLGSMRQIVIGAFAHQEYPFDLLVEKLQPERDPSRSPIFQTAFVMQNVGYNNRTVAPLVAGGEGEGISLGELTLESVPLREAAAQFDLTLTVVETGGELAVELTYNTDLYEAGTAERLLQSYQSLLQAMVSDPHAAVSTLPIITEQEKERLLQRHQSTAAYAKEQTIHQWFERQANLQAAKVAVVCGEERLTYGELNSRANQLAHQLRKLGVGPEVLVGLAVERSIEMIVGILGILKAGGAYLPLDPAYPKERLHFMLSDAQVPVILTQQRLLPELPQSDAQVICLDADWPQIATNSSENLNQDGSPDQLAYVIYTSGSTGKPKGVMIPHYQVVRLFQATQPWYAFNEQDVWSLFHSFAFDFSVWEIWGALLYGGRLVIVPYLVSRSPEDFYRLLCEEGVTVLNQTPSAFAQLIRAEEAIGVSDQLALRLVIFGGEALDIQSLAPWFERHGDQSPQLVNMYGITETTVHVTYRPLSKRDLQQRNSFIGRPIPDLQIYILDQHLQPVPVGVAGEMFVGGAGVARGYLNRPDLTAERFIVNPYDESQRLYRSGDLARCHANGDIEYLGRIDHQVKVRGFRIELNEIEAVLSKHPAVRDNVVLARNDLHGEKQLAAYVVTAASASLDVGELRRYLQDRLPAFMVPSAIYLLEAMPITENGKVDRKALLAITHATPDTMTSYVPPSTPEEEVLVSVWQNVLGVEKVGIDDNFFQLGGDSIRSIRILSEAKERGLHLTIQDLFQHQTIRQLAQVAQVGAKGSEQQHMAAVEPFSLISAEDRLAVMDGVEDAYPLSTTQAAFVYHSEVSSDYQVYISSYRLRAPFEREALEIVLDRLAARHPILRTSFDHQHFSQPLQLVYREAKLSLDVEDLRTLPAREQSARLAARLERERRTPFDWQQPGLCRFYVCRFSDEEFQLVLIEPFLDGWSVVSLITELITDYSAIIAGQQLADQPPLSSTYRQFVELEQQTLQSEEAKQFWNRKLEDYVNTPLYRLPEMKQQEKKRAEMDQQKDRIWVPLSPEVSEGLRTLAESLGVPLKNVLLAAHMKVLSIVTGQTDVTTGLIANGRLEHSDGENVLGIFLNTLPLRMDVSQATWEELIKQAFAAERELLPYRRYPLVELQRQHSAGQPLFDVVFNYTHFHVAEQVNRLSNVEMLSASQSDYTYVPLTAQFTLDVNTRQIQFALDFEVDELTAGQVEKIAGYYQNVLQAIVADPQGRHETNAFLSAEELQHLLGEQNSRYADYPVDVLFTELFARQASRTAERPVVWFEQNALTYSELEKKSNQLARYLRARGVGRDVFVGYFGERNLDWVIAIMAIFKAGGIYVPLDPAYPKERLSYMIEDAEMKLLLTYESLKQTFPDKAGIAICLDSDWEEIAQESDQPVDSGCKPEDVAYVIYTSGSTGRPKGAMVEHRGMVNHLYAKVDELGMSDADRVAQNSSHCVDISVWQLFAVMLTGGCVVILKDEDAFDPSRQLDAMERFRLTIVETVPSLLRAMLEEISLREASAKPDLTDLRWMIPNGEVLPPELCRKWLQHYPHAHLINAYGPTECSDDVMHHFISEPPADDVTSIPIGRPIANMQMYVLDRHRQPVPVGVAGELYIGGIGVGRGYLKAPEKNAETFLTNPFAAGANPRLYKTGDLVRRRPDGLYEFLGRIDHQVKIRGFRIELGEIESQLGKHPAIEHVAVVAKEDQHGEKRLAAYFVAAPGMSPTKTELRSFLLKQLPEHMIPSFFVQLAEFPLTLNGKIDRKALPAPIVDETEEDRYVAPRTPLEQELASIWGQVLGYERVGVDDHFMEQGGHSLLATQLISRIRKAYQIELPLRTLFEAPTLGQLAEKVEMALKPQPDDELGDLLNQLEQLSDEEAEALLQQWEKK
ncbi:amino acid adenylation domain-containing protein [Brevibacillus humidisoli]|uniref:non-ribosomal peptide synthetase n=1 Tax=Brevibacillus humidisoli TaxID=2895522 RepID=UPI001E598F00|nr:non-ribosomal peptide synthetase [Brevibacillus humidisoli]UFJ41460.1 amino acid adenylation domain-containing protein [Brevibacillus humidisoli]